MSYEKKFIDAVAPEFSASLSFMASLWQCVALAEHDKVIPNGPHVYTIWHNSHRPLYVGYTIRGVLRIYDHYRRMGHIDVHGVFTSNYPDSSDFNVYFFRADGTPRDIKRMERLAETRLRAWITTQPHGRTIEWQPRHNPPDYLRRYREYLIERQRKLVGYSWID